jgi:flagellar biosynthesis/type III secretory pathway protein FliH
MNENTDKKTFGEASLSDNDRQTIVSALKNEGFNEEQLNAMAYEKVWNLYIDSVEKTLEDMLSDMGRMLERNPKLASMSSPMFKEVIRQLTDLADSMEKELDKKKKEENDRHE